MFRLLLLSFVYLYLLLPNRILILWRVAIWPAKKAHFLVSLAKLPLYPKPPDWLMFPGKLKRGADLARAHLFAPSLLSSWHITARAAVKTFLPWGDFENGSKTWWMKKQKDPGHWCHYEIALSALTHLSPVLLFLSLRDRQLNSYLMEVISLSVSFTCSQNQVLTTFILVIWKTEGISIILKTKEMTSMLNGRNQTGFKNSVEFCSVRWNGTSNHSASTFKSLTWNQDCY